MSDISTTDRLMLGALFLGSTALLGFLDLAPHEREGDVAVVFPPWVHGGEALARAAGAGAALVDTGRWSFIVVVRPSMPQYMKHVLAAGALAVVDPRGPYGCFVRRARPA